MSGKENPPPYSGPPPAGFHPPPPEHHQAPPPTTSHTVFVTQTTVSPMILGPQPASITCPSCHAQIVTSVSTEANTKTHLFALLLCMFGCWPCCCIPYCMDSCQGQSHYCPNCRAFLGTYSN